MIDPREDQFLAAKVETAGWQDRLGKSLPAERAPSKEIFDGASAPMFIGLVQDQVNKAFFDGRLCEHLNENPQAAIIFLSERPHPIVRCGPCFDRANQTINIGVDSTCDLCFKESNWFRPNSIQVGALLIHMEFCDDCDKLASPGRVITL